MRRWSTRLQTAKGFLVLGRGTISQNLKKLHSITSHWTFIMTLWPSSKIVSIRPVITDKKFCRFSASQRLTHHPCTTICSAVSDVGVAGTSTTPSCKITRLFSRPSREDAIQVFLGPIEGTRVTQEGFTIYMSRLLFWWLLFEVGRKLVMHLCSSSGRTAMHWRNCWRGRRRDAEGDMPVKLIATINDAGATSGLRSCGSCGCWILMLLECTQGTRRQRREVGPLAGGGRF
jgi:hypothetical protein